MVLKLRVRAKPMSQESKRPRSLKTVQSDKSPKHVLKEARQQELQKESRPKPNQLRSNSHSPQRRSTNASTNPRQHSPTSVHNSSSPPQSLRWPYAKTSIIPDVSNIKVPPYRANLHDDFYSDFYGYMEPSSPKTFGLPAKDPVATVRKNTAELVDQTTMTRALSSVSSSSSYPESGPRHTDMFLPSPVLAGDEYETLHYSTNEPSEQTLYRTSDYLEPVTTRPSHHQYSLPSECARLQNSVTSIPSNQVTPRVQCECPNRQHLREEKKVLYNEGIFDYQSYCPKRRILKTPPSTPMRSVSRTREQNKSRERVNIPFSHYTDSKYHNCCIKRTPGNVMKDFQPVFSGSQKQCKGIALPKRVLASEVDIDAFLYTTPGIIKSRNKLNHWNMCPHNFPGEL